MEEDGQDLACCVPCEQERGQVGEGYDGDGVEDEQLPDAFVLQVERGIHAYYDANGDVHLEDVSDQIGSPVGRQTDT